jgi:hypothetical protein
MWRWWWSSPKGLMSTWGSDAGCDCRGSLATHNYSYLSSSLVNRSAVGASNQIHAAGFADGATHAASVLCILSFAVFNRVRVRGRSMLGREFGSESVRLILPQSLAWSSVSFACTARAECPLSPARNSPLNPSSVDERVIRIICRAHGDSWVTRGSP